MKTKEPPYTERYVRWCGRSVDKIIIYLLPDLMQQSVCKNEREKIMDNSKKSFLGELIKEIIVAIITCLLTGFITNQFTKNDIIKAITTRFDFVDSKMTYE